MNLRFFNSLLWGNSVALAWMWGLGLFFSVQITFMFGFSGLLLFAIPNALGLMLFGWITQKIADRQPNKPDSLALFFEKLKKPFGLSFILYQVIALSLTVFALANYLFRPLTPVSDSLLHILFLGMAILVMLGAGCLLGEELGITKIKYGHALLGLLIIACITTILVSLPSSVTQEISLEPVTEPSWQGPSLAALMIPLFIGLLAGPWLDLQHWQRAIQIRRENTSVRASYIWGGIIFFLLLLFHGSLTAWVLSNTEYAPSLTEGLDGFYYAHQVVVKYINSLPPEVQGLLPLAYFGFLGLCVLTTLDSGYLALKWFFGITIAKSQSPIVGLIPERILTSPVPIFFIVMLIAIFGIAVDLELEYFMVFYASFFIAYEALVITRCFSKTLHQSLPQIRLFSVGVISLIIFAFGYCFEGSVLMLLGSLLPLIYVVWLEFSHTELAVVPSGSMNSPQSTSPSTTSARTEVPQASLPQDPTPAHVHSGVFTSTVTPDASSLSGHFEGNWFVYSFIATYQDTNSVGNIYFGRYGLFVGKTRELFFNAVMPDFDLSNTSFYILTRSYEHKFIKEAKEFDTITVKIRVADFNRKFCTLEHQIVETNGDLLGKGKQSLLFVASKDYSLLDIPQEVYLAFIPYATGK